MHTEHTTHALHACTLHIHTRNIPHTHCTHTLHIAHGTYRTHTAHTLHTLTARTLNTPHTHCTRAHCIHTRNIPHTHCTHTLHICTWNIPHTHCTRTAHTARTHCIYAHGTYHTRTAHALHTLTARTLNTPHTHCTRTLHIRTRNIPHTHCTLTAHTHCTHTEHATHTLHARTAYTHTAHARTHAHALCSRTLPCTAHSLHTHTVLTACYAHSPLTHGRWTLLTDPWTLHTDCRNRAHCMGTARVYFTRTALHRDALHCVYPGRHAHTPTAPSLPIHCTGTHGALTAHPLHRDTRCPPCAHDTAVTRHLDVAKPLHARPHPHGTITAPTCPHEGPRGGAAAAGQLRDLPRGSDARRPAVGMGPTGYMSPPGSLWCS
nr:uncharacterized protein LOC125628739 isoform X4 [Caretta caretta]